MRTPRWRLLLACIAIFMSPASAMAAPIYLPTLPGTPVPTPVPPTISAASWIVYDDTYDLELASFNPDARRPMASTTKIMTALIALESDNLDRMVLVSEAAAAAGESEIGLVAGEELKLRDLVSVMVVRSANDAAVAVAESVGGSVDGFVGLMNERARDLGLANTQFVNPHGLHDPNHYSSAADLLALARTAMGLPEFARLAATRHVSLQPAPDGTHREADSTNQILTTYEGAIGVKTGYTFESGLVFVATAERDGRRIYAVVMGSRGVGGHFKDATTLLDFGFESFGLIPVVLGGWPIGTFRSGQSSTELTPLSSLEELLPVDAKPVPDLEVVDGSPFLVTEGGTVALDSAQPPPLPTLSSVWAWVTKYFTWFKDG